MNNSQIIGHLEEIEPSSKASYATVLIGVALSILLVLVGIVIYQKGLIQKLFLQRSKRICRTARKRNKRVAATESLFGSYENNTHLTISSHNIPFNHYENDRLWYADEARKGTSKNSFREGNDLSQTKKPKLSIPRHDSVLISAFEVEHIRQIQNFLLFPILNPLSKHSQPTPEIWQERIGGNTDVNIGVSDEHKEFDKKEKVLKIKDDTWKKLAAAAIGSGVGGMALSKAIEKNSGDKKSFKSGGIISDFMDIWKKEDRSGTNFDTIDENLAPVHPKKDERRMSLAVPKIFFSSPTPAPSPSEDSSGDFKTGGILTREGTPRNDNSKRKYPLIVERLNDEAKRIFSFRSQNKKNKQNEDKNYSGPTTLMKHMDSLRVPKTNLLRKTSTSAIPKKMHKVVGKNNKPYYVLQDDTLNNFLYYNKQVILPKTPSLVKDKNATSLDRSKDMANHAKGFLNEQLGKLETIEIPHSQVAPNQNQLMVGSLNPSLGARPGWMSPAPYSGKTGGRRVSITMNQFSYNFK